MYGFPWSNFHELNLDWILKVVKEAKDVWTKGRDDIDYAVATADEAKEIATQAAQAQVADNSVSTPKIVDGAVTTVKIADAAVTTAKIDDAAVTTGKIANAAVTNAKIADSAITTPKIADDSITSSKLADDSVGVSDLDPAVRARTNVFKCVLFIGDSYATGNGGGIVTTPWPTTLAGKLNLSAGNWWTFAHGGESFGIYNGQESNPTSGYNFCDRLREAINTLTDAERESIDHIIVGGGINDWQYTASDIDTGFGTFYAMRNQYFPHAQVVIATFGGGLVPAYKYPYFTTVLPAYFNSAATYKYKYLDCFAEIYRQKDNFHTDGTHLTNTGENSIALELFEKLTGGMEKYVERRYQITGSFIGITAWDGKQYHLYPTATEINLASPVTLSSTWVKIGEANTTQLNGGTSSTAQQFNIPCMVLCAGVMYNSVNLTFQFRHIDNVYDRVEVWVRQVGYWEGQGFKSFANVSRFYLSAQYVELSAMNM